MKAKKQDIGIRELFRSRLENAVVIPDISVNDKLMRKVAGREFVRFNPGRFNIYYLGGILIAAVTAGILLFSGTGKSKKSTPAVIMNESVKPENPKYINIPEGAIIFAEQGKMQDSNAGSVKNNIVPGSEIISDKRQSQKSEQRTNRNFDTPVINSSFVKNGLFGEKTADNKKLKSGYENNGVLLVASALNGCAPLKIHFTNTISKCDSCSWTFGDGGYSNQKNSDWIFDVEGEYKVVLKVFGPNGLQTTSSTLITVYNKPVASFEIAPEKAVIPDDEIRFINYSTDGIHFLWDFGDGSTSVLYEPKHTYSKFGNYTVRLSVTSENGCTDSLSVLNAFSGSEYFIEFPNAFVPNPEGPSGGLYSSKSDETIQVFHPTFSGVSEYQLKIFSKLGILIFESNDVNIGWDGYLKGQLNNYGVYIWKVRGNFSNGEPFVKMGDVTLLKK